MSDSDDGIVKALDLKSIGRFKVVECGSERRYRIKRLSNREFIGLIGALPQVASVPSTESEVDHVTKKLVADSAQLIQRAESLVSACLIEPPIGTDDDSISVEDIPYGDLQELASEIISWHGLNVGVSKQLRPI